jgi:hypothetical protein
MALGPFASPVPFMDGRKVIPSDFVDPLRDRIKQFIISLDLAKYISIGSSGMNDSSASDSATMP